MSTEKKNQDINHDQEKKGQNCVNLKRILKKGRKKGRSMEKPMR